MGSYDRLPFTNTRPCAGTRFLLTVPRFLFAARVFPREAPFLPPHPEPDGDHRRLHNGGLCALSEWQTCPYKLLGTPHPPPHATQTTRLHYRAFFFSLFGSSVPWFTRQTDMTKDLSDRTSDYWAGMSWRGSSDKSVWFYPHDDLLFITSGGGVSCVIRRAVENAHYGSPLPVIDSPVFITVYFSQYMSVFPVSSWTAGRTWPSLVTWDCKYLQIRTALSWVMNAFA